MNQSYSQSLAAANHPKADEMKKQLIYAKTLEEWREVLEQWYV